MTKGKVLNWGILSTAKINKALLPALRMSKRSRLLALASRTQEQAAAYAKEQGIPRAYGSYAALLADPEIDVVYIPLPNHLHAEWTIQAVQAGKHVLCEKPLALSLQEIDAVGTAAREHDRIVAEALMYRSHPLMQRVLQIVQAGQLGRLQLVRGSFTFKGASPDDYRLRPEMGGGSLYDVGIYPLSYARAVLGSEPLEAFGWQVAGPTGVDQSFYAQLRFPGEVFVQFDCSMATPYHVFMEIIGDEGTLIVPQPFIPVEKERLFLTKDGKIQTIQVNGIGTYLGEVEDMADAVLLGRPQAVSLTDSRGSLTAVLALFESARTGRPVSLK
jgi:predicted dehydrogenase